jgi:hypothetical protein
VTEVRVTWHDARDADGSWVSEADAQAFGETMCVVVSLGFKVRQTDKYLTIAGDWNIADKDWGRVMKIPTDWVIKVEDVT